MYNLTSPGFRNVPTNTFATAISAPKDFDRKKMQRDRGIIYQPNGTGRDTYIYNDDGGFAKLKEPRPQFHPGTLLLPSMQHKKFYSRYKKPTIHSRPIQYQSDGSGRDSYVKMTNGGLSHPNQRMREYRQAFKSSLRAYQPIPSSYYLD